MFSSLSSRSLRCSVHLRSPACRATFRTSPLRRFPRVNERNPQITGEHLSHRLESRTPSFKEELLKDDPTYDMKTFMRSLNKPKIGRQILFATTGMCLSFILAAVFSEEDTEHWKEALESAKGWSLTGMSVSSEDMRRARQFSLAKKLQNNVKKLQDALAPLPKMISNFFVWTYAQVATSYLNASEGGRLAWQIGALNAAVWVAWQIPRLHPVMAARFMHHPLSGRATTLLTSMFSHQSLVHLAFNTIALTSFGSASGHFLAQRQAQNPDGTLESTPRYHLLAVFISAGLFSGLVSHVVAARIHFPRIIKHLSSTTKNASNSSSGRFFSTPRPPNDILPSLGASGGVYALVTMTALAYKDAEVSMFFLPLSIPIQWGVGGMVALDVLGIIRGWRMFDHWAHLGGAAFGAIYWKYGPSFWDALRADYEDEDEDVKLKNS
ncbi:hypothetical protein SCHPADRAFT_867276 [Schizopora paradoxa]|uniref:Peptidase S54 rhomboid domain-containing protein n=1 Tax=Schizopora paradoxa TaxID=27342 RepID=A0A0H2SLI2_9AGAM|nr:hypothetical protein SCHPADRAFT_867276 [Schizopora paradoxa]